MERAGLATVPGVKATARAVAVAAALGVAAVGLAPVAAAATSKPRPLFPIAVGDTVRVSGTPSACAATGRPGAAGLLCSLLGKDGKEPQGSYGVALGDRGEALVIRFGSGGAAAKPEQVWRVKASRSAGAVAVAVAVARSVAPVTHVTDVGGGWFLAGTDIRCHVKRADLLPGVVCSRFDARGVRPGTNSIAITPAAAGIYRYDAERRAVRKIEKAEPDRATASRRPQVRVVAAARAAATPVTEIVPGDQLRIAGSGVACLATRNGAKSAVLCLLLANASTPLPSSYAVGLAEDGEAILVAYDRSSRGALVTRFTQAARAAAAPRRADRLIGARLGAQYRLQGTDVLCSVGASARPAGISCFMTGPQGRIVGSPGIALVDGTAARIFRVASKTAVSILVEKPEPGARRG